MNPLAGWRVGTTEKAAPLLHQLSRRRRTAMASSRCSWIITLVVISVLASDTGVFGRAVVDVRGHQPQSPELYRPTLRTDALRRWRRGIAETHQRERCAELTAPWMETGQPPQDDATFLRLRVRPFSPGASQGTVFPGKALFSFIRRVYRCCQEGSHCTSVRGIQGRMSGDTDVELLLTRDVLAVAVVRAELHLQLFNPQHLDIQPVLPSMAKRHLPTRFSVWSRGDMVELRVDLLFLFQGLQEAAGGAGRGPTLVNMRQVGGVSRGGPPSRERPAPRSLQDTEGDLLGEGFTTPPALELGLALSCSQAGLGVPCAPRGVQLAHSPFMALSYR